MCFTVREAKMPIKRMIEEFLGGQQAQDLVEYALVLVFLALAAITVMTLC